MSFISRLTEKFLWYINTPYFSAKFQENCMQFRKKKIRDFFREIFFFNIPKKKI